MFMGTDWRSISEHTARRLLEYLTYEHGKGKTGMYIDGHEREDVVEYRNDFLKRMLEHALHMVEYDKDGLEVGTLKLKEGQRQLVHLTHDESTFYANDQRKVTWRARDEKATPLPKGQGQSIMVSDFLSPDFGQLKDLQGYGQSLVHSVAKLTLQNSESRVLFKAGASHEGYFTNDHLVEQTEKAMDIFECTYPNFQALFIYDNATTHQKHASDALSALKMPLHPRIWTPKGVKMRVSRLADGTSQELYWPAIHHTMPGHFKGMKRILQEHHLWTVSLLAQCSPNFSSCKGKTSCCARRFMFNQPDFIAQKSRLEEIIEKQGHICDFYPKFHCGLNFIEQYWGAAKYEYRSRPGPLNTNQMEQNVVTPLDSVPLLQIKRSVS